MQIFYFYKVKHSYDIFIEVCTNGKTINLKGGNYKIQATDHL